MKNKRLIDNLILKMSYTANTTLDPSCVVYDQDIIAQIDVTNINESDKDERTLLMYATVYERESVIDYLIAKQANIFLHDKLGFTALHFAVQTGNRTIIKKLLEHGADINAEDKYGNCPLMKCNYGTPIGVFELLVEFGANPCHKNKFGVSPLDVFSRQNDIMNVLSKIRGGTLS